MTLHPGDYLYPSVDELERPDVYARGGAKDHEGEGVAMKSLLVEGPRIEAWPPEGTRTLVRVPSIFRPWVRRSRRLC
jgi:hypothetical protein